MRIIGSIRAQLSRLARRRPLIAALIALAGCRRQPISPGAGRWPSSALGRRAGR
jgi:hypothetical protein